MRKTYSMIMHFGFRAVRLYSPGAEENSEHFEVDLPEKPSLCRANGELRYQIYSVIHFPVGNKTLIPPTGDPGDFFPEHRRKIL